MNRRDFFLLACLGCAILGPHAAAHPFPTEELGRFSELTLHRDGVDIKYTMGLTQLLAIEEIALMNTNGDTRISKEEKSTYFNTLRNTLRQGLTLELDGRPVDLTIGRRRIELKPPYYRIMYYRCRFEPLGAGKHRILFRDDNYPNVPGPVELTANADADVELLSRVNIDLSKEYRELQAGGAPSDQLQMREIEILFRIEAGGPPKMARKAKARDAPLPAEDASKSAPRQAPDPAIATPEPARRETADSGVDESRPVRGDTLDSDAREPEVVEVEDDDGQGKKPQSERTFDRLQVRSSEKMHELANRLFKGEIVGVGGTLFVLGAFFLLGAFHALSPGHGKTVVAAYLIGSRGRIRDAVFLGLVVTLTHTGSVVILGVIVKLLKDVILPSRLNPFIASASGLLIFGMGVSLFVSRLRRGSVVGAHHPAHDHDHGHSHDHDHDHGHSHSHVPEGEVTLLSLLSLGIAGGIVPCPSALAVLLTAVNLNHMLLGLGLLLCFSSGLALVLIAIGVLMVTGRMRLSKGAEESRLIRLYLPLASAAAIAAIGVLMMIVPLVSANILVIRLNPPG